MPSPFPGMNPYLEQADVWQDFHQSLIPLLRQLLSAQVRPKYVVKIEEQLFIHEAPADGRAPLSLDTERHAFLEIRNRGNRQLVAVIEVLSPSNKHRGPDRQQYLAKRQQLLASQVHLVELDLLRGGPRLPIEEMPACDYVVMVSRYEDRPNVGMWPLALRDPLPTIPIPLSGQEQAALDLQAALHEVYDAAGYEDYIYLSEPAPSLSETDAEWTRRLLADSASNGGE